MEKIKVCVCVCVHEVWHSIDCGEALYLVSAKHVRALHKALIDKAKAEWTKEELEDFISTTAYLMDKRSITAWRKFLFKMGYIEQIKPNRFKIRDIEP